MKHSDSIKEIAAALAKAQGAMGGAKKDSNNPFFKSMYADLASVVEAIKDAFSANGISYVQSLMTNEKDECGVETMLMHGSGEWILAEPFFVPVAKQDAQGFGSAGTYCRRYALAAICGVAPEDDDGNAAATAKKDATNAPAAKTAVAPGPPRKMRADAFQAHCTQIGNATTNETLQRAFTVAYTEARSIGDAEAQRSFTEKKDTMKELIAEAKAKEQEDVPQ